MLKIERQRETKETDVSITMDFDGSGKSSISTGLPFFDHMLTSMARHGRIDTEIDVEGDLDVDDHHVTEDVGIVLGEVILQAQKERPSIRRFGSAIIPMDDALILMAIDLGGRTYVDLKVDFKKEYVGSFVLDNIKHFMRSMADTAYMNLHAHKLSGSDDHHLAEALFKSLGISLSQALKKDPSLSGEIPSTKGRI